MNPLEVNPADSCSRTPFAISVHEQCWIMPFVASGGAASKRRMHALAVLVSSSMLYNIATGGMVPPERCTPACKGEGPMQEAIKVSRSLVDRAVPPGYGGAP